VVVGPSGDAVPARADPLDAKPEAPLQSIEVDAARGVEVDPNFRCHVLLPIQAVDTQSGGRDTPAAAERSAASAPRPGGR